jgi:hypothetical protein
VSALEGTVYKEGFLAAGFNKNITNSQNPSIRKMAGEPIRPKIKAIPPKKDSMKYTPTTISTKDIGKMRL